MTPTLTGRVALVNLTIFLVSTCGLVYELIAGTLASYLLGDSILQFSTVIGDYLFAMGVGSFLAQYLSKGEVVPTFVRLQLHIGLLGGCSAALMHLSFSYTGGFRVVLYSLVFLVGMLVGAEIPLIMSILKDHLGFRRLVSQVLALDYLGALLASIVYPLLLVPHLGLIRTSFLCGLINVVVAVVFIRSFSEPIPPNGGDRSGGPGFGRGRNLALWIQAALSFVVLMLGMIFANRLTTLAEEGLYPDDILMTRTTAYQRIVVTRRHNDVRLYLNGNLQFSSRDEYRYHEVLVHPALTSCATPPKEVLILGGGDGLAARELLKEKSIDHITLVDLDPEMTRLFATHPLLTGLNQGSLRDPRLTVINGDAFVWLEKQTKQYDLAIVDFPDPSNYSVGKLFTTTFYRTLAHCLKPDSPVCVQCTSPLFARQSYWCIISTIEAAGFKVRPLHIYVPSFGEWGYALASRTKLLQPNPALLVADRRFINGPIMADLFIFPEDMARVPAQVNQLFEQPLVRYYDRDWRSVVE